MLTIQKIKVCHRVAPIGLDEVPSFGWVLKSDDRNALQKAYQIRVFAGDKPVWDPGPVESRESVAVSYAGDPLLPGTLYRVRLTVWDNLGNMAEAETTFETGMLRPSNFSARWITHTLPGEETACPVFCAAPSGNGWWSTSPGSRRRSPAIGRSG